MTTFHLRVDLNGQQPPVWRELLVPAHTSLSELHLVIQAAMGWENSDPYAFAEATEHHSIGTLLATAGDAARYRYGDRWEHRLTLVQATDDGVSRPILLDGAGHCPGEGPDAMDLWNESPAPLDLPDAAARVAAVTASLPALPVRLADLLAQAPGRGPGSVAELIALADLQANTGEIPDGEDAVALTANLRWFLALVGSDGLPLTGAGNLRPAVVIHIAERFQLQREWIGKLNREDGTPGVLNYRAAVRELGLTRSINGSVRLTKRGAALAGDPQRLLDHVIARLPLDPPGTFAGDAALVMMLELAGRYAGPGSGVERRIALEMRANRRVSRVLTGLGWRVEDGPVPSGAFRYDVRRTGALLARSGVLVDGAQGPRWEATQVGRQFLRAVLRRG